MFQESVTEVKCPPRRCDNALDPGAIADVHKSKEEFLKMFNEARDLKMRHLDRMHQSELYKKKLPLHGTATKAALQSRTSLNPWSEDTRKTRLNHS